MSFSLFADFSNSLGWRAAHMKKRVPFTQLFGTGTLLDAIFLRSKATEKYCARVKYYMKHENVIVFVIVVVVLNEKAKKKLIEHPHAEDAIRWKK